MKDIFHSQTVIFAAGCFWGVQDYFDQVPGVLHTLAGYTGGRTSNPISEQVRAGNTGHAESVWIEYNPSKINFNTLLKHFFRMHDPTQLNKQGPDIGSQYRSAVFCTTAEQRRLARRAKANLQKYMEREIVTQIRPAGEFWEAEAYHQNFARRTGVGKCYIPYMSLDKQGEVF